MHGLMAHYGSGGVKGKQSISQQDTVLFKRGFSKEVVPGERARCQITNEGVKRNVMSVELALERELEYREKLEQLQRQYRYDLEAPPKSVVVSPSHLERGEMSRPHGRTPDPVFSKSEHERKIPQEEITVREVPDGRVGKNFTPLKNGIKNKFVYQRKMDRSRCQPTTRFQGSACPDPQMVGVKRKSASNDLTCSIPQKFQQSQNQKGGEIKLANLFCKECQVFCPGEYNLQQHYMGRKHKTRLAELARKRNGDTTEVGFVWCDVCSIPCMNGQNYQQHLAGKKHAACAQAFKKATQFGGKGAGESSNGKL